jgi:hypothetical protein
VASARKPQKQQPLHTAGVAGHLDTQTRMAARLLSLTAGLHLFLARSCYAEEDAAPCSRQNSTRVCGPIGCCRPDGTCATCTSSVYAGTGCGVGVREDACACAAGFGGNDCYRECTPPAHLAHGTVKGGGGLYISLDSAGYPVEYACDAGYDLRGLKVADCEVNGNYQMPVRSRFSPYSVPLVQLMLVCPYRRAKRLHAGRLLLTTVASGIVTK